MRRLVFLVDADKFPHTGVSDDSWQRMRGQPIWVCEPQEPSFARQCGSPFVWRVDPESVRAIHGDVINGNYFVCIHQIDDVSAQRLLAATKEAS